MRTGHSFRTIRRPVRHGTDRFSPVLGALALFPIPNTREMRGPFVAMLYVIAVVTLWAAVALSHRGRFRSMLDRA